MNVTHLQSFLTICGVRLICGTLMVLALGMGEQTGLAGRDVGDGTVVDVNYSESEGTGYSPGPTVVLLLKPVIHH